MINCAESSTLAERRQRFESEHPGYYFTPSTISSSREWELWQGTPDETDKLIAQHPDPGKLLDFVDGLNIPSEPSEPKPENDDDEDEDDDPSPDASGGFLA